MKSTNSPDQYDASALGESNRKLAAWDNKKLNVLFFCVVTSPFANIPFTFPSPTFIFFSLIWGTPLLPFPCEVIFEWLLSALHVKELCCALKCAVINEMYP